MFSNLPAQAASFPPIRFLLTFDDGPSASADFNSTEQILDKLAHNDIQPGIKALFFVQTRATNGGGTALGRQIMQREWDEGHLLGLHTATPRHTSHRDLSESELQTSLENGMADLTEVTGSAPKLIRPPFWSFDQRTFLAYQKNHLHMLLTDLNAKDGKIWGINFSFSKHRTFYRQLANLRERWLHKAPILVDGCVPVVVTFHDVNGFTANQLEVYLQILVEVAAELNLSTTPEPFFDNREDIERAALKSTAVLHDLFPSLASEAKPD